MAQKKNDPILTQEKINTLEKIKEFGIENIGTYFTIEELAEAFSKETGIYTNVTFIKTYSKPHFHKQMHEVINDKRMEIGAEEVLKGEKKLFAIAQGLGLKLHTFLAMFKKKYQKTPTKFRRYMMNTTK